MRWRTNNRNFLYFRIEAMCYRKGKGMKKICSKAMAVILSASFVLTSIIVTPLASYADEEPAEIMQEVESTETVTETQETVQEEAGTSEEIEDASRPQNEQIEDAQTETVEAGEEEILPDEADSETEKIVADVESEDKVVDEEDEKANEDTENEDDIIAQGVCGANLVWKLDDEGVLIISGTGAMSDYAYTTSSNGVIVETPWGDYATDISYVVLDDGVTSIGDLAFGGCSSLTSITIPDSVTSIGQSAFIDCSSLTSITIPGSVTSIGQSAFSRCSSLISVTISEGVTSIWGYAFSDCSSLTSITIPNSVTTIGADTFENCNNLETAGPIGGGYNIELGWTTYIPKSVFMYNSSLTSVTIPEGVTSIGDSAFFYCSSLTSITIPDSVTSIGKHAFSGCTGLTSVIIPNGLKSIGAEAFLGCGVTSVTIPSSVISIGEKALGYGDTMANPSGFVITGYDNTAAQTYASKNSIEFISLGEAETSDDDTGLGSCGDNITWKLSTVDNKDILTVSGSGKMYDYGDYNLVPWNYYSYYIDQVYLDGEITSIGDNAFYNCSSLTSVTIPGSVTSIGDDAFSGCSSLTSITIPDSTTSIGDHAFYVCSGLTSVTIPDSVTSIGDHAFDGCSSLTSITIPDSVTSIGLETFYECSFKTAGPIGGGYDYEFGWTTNIPSYAFELCSSLTSITIPDSVTSIGDYAFSGCSSLTSITLPEKVTSIGKSAFSHCSSVSLPSITILGGVGEYAFYGCSRLTNVNISQGVTSIGQYAFCGCTGLTSVTISGSVTSIGNSAFGGCSRLTSVTISDGVKTIGRYAFMGCSSLSSITIPSSVVEIGLEAVGMTQQATVENFIIYGYKSSAADTYAEKNDITFVAIDGDCEHCSADEGKITDSEEATCVTKGYIKYICSKCGEEVTIEFDIDPDKHTGNTEVKNKKEATCDEEGYTGDTYCKDCGVKLSSGETVSATGDHTWDEGKITTQATCKAKGVKTYTCTVCSDTKTEDVAVDPDNHTGETETKNKKEATCGEEGYTGDTCCKDCGVKLSSGETVPATGSHTWDEGKLTKQATTSANGTLTYTCTTCGDTYIDVIYKASSISLAETSYVYTGGAKEPAVTVYDSEGNVIDSSNYTVAYTNNKNVGTATATVTFKNYYKGSLTADYTIIPATPAAPTVAAASTGLKLTWTADTTVTGYQIYRSVDGGGYSKIKTISNTSTTSYTDTSAASGSTYTYKIRAYKKVDGTNYFSEYSDEVPYTFLTAPASLKAINNTSGTKLTWSAVTGATGYYVYRKADSGSYTKLATVDTNSYTDTSAESGVTYMYRLKAYMTAEDATYASAYCTAVTNRYVDQPVISKAANAASGVKIVWAKVSNATGYQVYRCEGASGSYKKIATATGTAYTDTTAVSGKTYTYKIRAYQKVDGTNYFGAYSTVKTFVCVARPTISKITSAASGKLYVKWDANTAATVYLIVYATKSDFSDAITVTNKGSTKNTKTITGLKGGKTYYTKVRTYITVNGVTYYSAYSAVKSIKVTK